MGSGVVVGGGSSLRHTRLKRPGACRSAAGAEALVRARVGLGSDLTPASSLPGDHLAS
jgi:hypothetical protein